MGGIYNFIVLAWHPNLFELTAIVQLFCAPSVCSKHPWITWKAEASGSLGSVLTLQAKRLGN